MKKTLFAAVFIAVPLLASIARADRRAYGATYEAVTAPRYRPSETRSWAGPAVSWAGGGHGALRGVWVTLAGGAVLGGQADAYYARAIVGLQSR